MDEVVQQVRKDAEDGELDQYQQRLVQCIVDPGMYFPYHPSPLVTHTQTLNFSVITDHV